MSLTNEEKGLIEEALSVYLQLVSQQLPQQQVAQVAAVAQGIINKLDSLHAGGADGAAAGRPGNKPAGISDEWFDNVCASCDMLGAGGCADKVTLKFPGKCDPILHYERKKA
ncbi:MAG: hypothetical protein LBH93_07285 [Chitinispirillales bacterium]|jgi:hypothetical protein|nr:hypothetical protein [Chitinispirillales bacterium]